MVVLIIKKCDEPQFAYETSITKSVDEVLKDVVEIFNGRLKITRICYELEELSKYGTMLPPEILGLTPDQVTELNLKDPWAERCAPHGWINNPDPIGRRCGRQPPLQLQTVFNTTATKAKEMISKNLCIAGKTLTKVDVAKALEEISGAVKIVYPMGLPPHDPVRQELENREELDGTQASLEVLDPAMTVIWYCGKQMLSGSPLSNHLGNNDKCKVVVKLCKRGEGAPAREPIMSEEDRKQWMLHAYRKQEELKVSRFEYILWSMIFFTKFRSFVF